MSRDTDVRCVWISGSRRIAARLEGLGLDAAYRWSVDGVITSLRASWYVFSGYRSDINVWLSHGATAFTLWHGVGIKRLRADAGVPSAAMYSAPAGSWTARLFADERLPPDWVLSSSSLMSSKFAVDFGVTEARCLEFGYPRNDHLVGGGKPPEPLVDPDVYRTLEQKRPVVGYFPTFRDNMVSLPVDDTDLSEMGKIIGEQGGVLLFKPHRYSTVPATSRGSLVVLPSSVDLNAHLDLCDVLITDYSSVAFDFLLLGRPVILFRPDFQHFRSGRGFFLDPTEMMPGILSCSKSNLFDILRDVDAIPVPENLESLRDLFWGASAQPGASQRVADFILDSLQRS